MIFRQFLQKKQGVGGETNSASEGTGEIGYFVGADGFLKLGVLASLVEFGQEFVAVDRKLDLSAGPC